jgi:outer membrane immunogenic protein
MTAESREALLKTILLASVAIGALMVGGAAYAADLPASAPVYKATPMAPPFSWAGFYLGIEGGGAWGKSRQRSDVGDIAPGFNLSGGLVGGTYGTNWQFGSWVLGMESDISWSDLKGSATEGPIPANTATTKQTWVGFDRGRVGYAWGQWMVFAAGGLAESTIEAQSIGPAGSISQSKYRLGWTGGGGVEWAFAPQWSAKVEYLYADFGSHTSYLNPVPAGFTNRAGGVSLNENIVRVGINYHYDLPGLLARTFLGAH